jgi:hypothetical protein
MPSAERSKGHESTKKEVSVGRKRDDEGLQDWEKDRQEDHDEREEVRQEERDERKQVRQEEREDLKGKREEQRRTQRNLGPGEDR